MARWRLAAVLCLVSAFAPAVATTPYVVDGVTLGDRFQPDREHQCQPSEQFPGFTWCQRKRTEGRGGVTAHNSILYRAEGALAYVSRRVAPASFAASDIPNEIKRLTARFGERPRVLRLPPREGVANAVIALWGGIELELVEGTELAALAAGGPPQRGLLIDYLGDVRRSAELGLPVFLMAGEAGYLWSARHDQAGRGALRFLAIDASALAATHAPTPPPGPVARAVHEPVQAPAETIPARSAEDPPPPRPISRAVHEPIQPPAETIPAKSAGDPPSSRWTGRAVHEPIQPPAVPATSVDADPEPVGTVAAHANATGPDQPVQPSPAGPEMTSAPAVRSVPVGTAPGVFAVLALVAVGLILARRRWVARERREALYAALYPRTAMAPAIEMGSPFKSYAAGAGLMAMAILVYVSSQSPATVRNVLGLFGWSGGTSSVAAQNR